MKKGQTVCCHNNPEPLSCKECNNDSGNDVKSEIRFPSKIYLTDQAVSRMLDLTKEEKEETVEWEYAFASKQSNTNWSFLSTVEHREEIRNETARCIAIAQKQLEEKDKEIEDLKKQLAIKTTSYDNLRELLGEICEEWNEDCDADCSSWGHTGTCKKINIAEAKKAMRLKIEGLEERFKTAIEALEELTVALEQEADFHGNEPHQLTQKARQVLNKAKRTENE
jgi:hypothetical protein